jgi:Fe-S-cluster containining protein
VRLQADDPALQESCPLLVDQRCTVYDARPLICRSHGLAVVERAGAAAAWCELNYTGGAPPSASVLQLERLNAPLAVAAALWEAGAPRIGLDELARAPDDA